jgi:hypothetical protein
MNKRKVFTRLKRKCLKAVQLKADSWLLDLRLKLVLKTEAVTSSRTDKVSRN